MSGKNEFWQSDTYQVIKALKANGNKAGLIDQMIEAAKLWAQAQDAGDPDAEALKVWLPQWKSRPFYTAAELTNIFPALIVALGVSRYLPVVKSPQRLAFELDYGGLYKLRNLHGSTGFRDQFGHMRDYYIVEQVGRWNRKPISQEDFENVLFG